MKRFKRITITLGWVIGLTVFIVVYIQNPTTNIARILGQLVPSLGIGAVVFLIIWGLGTLVIRITKRLK